jgi:hypothetical protein
VEHNVLVNEWVTGLLQFSPCELLVAEARGQFRNPEERERPLLEAITRRRNEDIASWEDLSMFYSELAVALQLLVVMSCVCVCVCVSVQ